MTFCQMHHRASMSLLYLNIIFADNEILNALISCSWEIFSCL